MEMLCLKTFQNFKIFDKTIVMGTKRYCKFCIREVHDTNTMLHTLVGYQSLKEYNLIWQKWRPSL